MMRRPAQLNIRSDSARRRVAELVAQTGKSATQVVEDAVRAYRPPPAKDDTVPAGMTLVGRFLVRQATGNAVTLDDTNRAIEADRMRGRITE
jgi:hypothetical protein